MNDLARTKLFDIVKSYGQTVCHTPSTCEIFLNQHCGELPAERKLLTQALRRGTVSRLIEGKDQPYITLSGRLASELASEVGVSEPDARWAVDSWALALGRHPSTAAPPPPPPPPVPLAPEVEIPSAVTRSKVWPPLIVALGGALGAVFATLLLTFLVYTLISSPRGRTPIQTDAIAAVVGLMMTVAGALGGALGGGGGWLLIQAQTIPTGSRDVARWRLARGFLAAMGGAFGSTLLGGWFGGFLGIGLGGLIGSFSGSVVTGLKG
jgi:hypothetical protein